MEIEISKAKQEDFSYIQEKIEKFLLDSTNIDWKQFFVARIRGKKIVSFGRIINHGDFFEIASLGVDYYHRRRGIGRSMLAFLVEEARRMDIKKPIYGVTHLEQFLATCGFIRVKDNYPEYLNYKRKYICRLDESKISVMKWSDGLA